jgi:transcriptional regulator GlxA family with amidase domain
MPEILSGRANERGKEMADSQRGTGLVVNTTSEIDPTGAPAPWPRKPNPVPVVHERRLLKIMQTLESRLPHSVKELAQEVRLSPAHLQRLFKHETGVDISDLLYERRLIRAADLLTTTNMGVKEVAFMVGYGHHSSFVRAFERRFGQPPSQYRLKRA